MNLKKILALLLPAERKQLGMLLIMVIFMALLDMLGIATIMPFLTVLSNPELVRTNTFLNDLYTISSHMGIRTHQQFLYAFGVFVIFVLIFSIIFKALTAFAQTRFALMREYSISKRLIEGYLHQPYSWFLNRNSADLGKTVLSEVNTVIGNGLVPMLSLFANGAVVISILALLLFIDFTLAISIGITFGLIYGSILKVSQRYLTRIGGERIIANQGRFTTLSEALGSTREVKLSGLESTYVNSFAEHAYIYAKHQTSAQIIAQLPRYVLEAVAFGGMMILILYLMGQSGDLAKVLPIISLYAFAGYRLMPAFQIAYDALTRMRFVGPSLELLHKDIVNLKSQNPIVIGLKFQFRHAISLKNVSYCYPNSSNYALKNISLSIGAKSKVGILGKTGSGKTTLVDVILGLLDPQEGGILIDGHPIKDENKLAWQRNIGYVPQQIYLVDNSIEANIAFGVDPHEIDQAAVELAAKIANVHEFVINDLPNGYQTKVGERGVRLSGGQRQRIGIARALYHKPQVLVMDEATSALDGFTEKEVMNAIQDLDQNITVILIAHRLSTLSKCDKVFLFDKGRLKKQGSYDEVVADHTGIYESGS